MHKKNHLGVDESKTLVRIRRPARGEKCFWNRRLLLQRPVWIWEKLKCRSVGCRGTGLNSSTLQKLSFLTAEKTFAVSNIQDGKIEPGSRLPFMSKLELPGQVLYGGAGEILYRSDADCGLEDDHQ